MAELRTVQARQTIILSDMATRWPIAGWPNAEPPVKGALPVMWRDPDNDSWVHKGWLMPEVPFCD